MINWRFLTTLARRRSPIKLVSGDDLFRLFAYACTQQYLCTMSWKPLTIAAHNLGEPTLHKLIASFYCMTILCAISVVSCVCVSVFFFVCAYLGPVLKKKKKKLTLIWRVGVPSRPCAVKLGLAFWSSALPVDVVWVGVGASSLTLSAWPLTFATPRPSSPFQSGMAESLSRLMEVDLLHPRVVVGGWCLLVLCCTSGIVASGGRSKFLGEWGAVFWPLPASSPLSMSNAHFRL